MTQEPAGQGLEEHDDAVAEHAPDQVDGQVLGDVVADVERVRTGDERVDSVIAAIEGLEGRPVEEHVAAFERAHDELRRALDSPPSDQA